MRVLIVHNYYQQPGGEDVVFAAEVALLRQHGHEVVEYTEDNRRINGMSRVAVAAHTIWSRPTRHRLLKILRDIKCDVVHFHNTFPLISPSAYSACREAGVPVVQTLHNYRLLCPSATFFRDGHVCEDCLNKTLPWPGVLHTCYRGSRSQTAMVAAMLTLHRWLKTSHEQVTIYIALTEFARRKFIEGGLPAEKLAVKPNFVDPDPGIGENNGDYALFVGRLSPEKGVRTLLRGWQCLNGIPLKIVGDGPLMDEVRMFVQKQKLDCVEVLGQRASGEVLSLMKGARFLVFPSEWYETFGRVAIEAFACGVPVIASRLGAMAEIVEEECTGMLFNPGNPQDLADKIRWAANHPEAIACMGKNARQIFEEKYTSEKNYKMLLDIYERAIRWEN
ncbi:MAG: glycosyltransferase family 4 protein [Candidatus Tectomicrobia bacterium]|nr:glycosyltransferase family 4 protein [Candidatus Tectomicrobia bacterium]